MAALTAYVILGGADFGGGVLDIVATGSGAPAQRAAVAEAMGPVWEVNHVWLIFVLVATWTCFPVAFANMFTALSVPLIIALAGIVLRGAAFAFRHYAVEAGARAQYMGFVFGAASILTPVFLGDAIGTLVSGSLNPLFAAASPWLRPFPIAIGLFALSLCALLAAVFLTVETHGWLQAVFRRRALIAWLATAVMGVAALGAAYDGAPYMFHALTSGPARPWFAFALGVGLITLWCLVRRRYRAARATAVAQVAAVLWAWAAAQYPYVIVPWLTITAAAAPRQTLLDFLVMTGAGMAVLLPSLWLLFAVFKGNARD